MQDNAAGTWLARDGDGRVVEVNAAGYPGAEADPGDGRPVAEADPQARQTFRVPLGPPLADQSVWPDRQPEASLSAARAAYADREARLGPCGPHWGAAERDWEAESG